MEFAVFGAEAGLARAEAELALAGGRSFEGLPDIPKIVNHHNV